MLTNGARYYVDHAHPEYSTPECATPMEVTLFDKAGERILARSMDAARRLLPAGQEIVVYKNNSDGKGNSYGCHENYLVDRNVPFAVLVRNLIPWFVTRQVFTGAGKVGSENGADPVDYQISQRADFFEEEVGLETTLKRPIVNTRDEPHADPQKYRRLHVIVGDANLCEVATFLKVGTTAIVLAMIEDGFIDKDLSIASPVAAIRSVSHDPSLRATVDVADVGRCTALDLQWEFLRLARKYADDSGLECCGGDELGTLVLDRWESVLESWSRIRCHSTGSSTGSPSSRCCARTPTATSSSGTTRSSSSCRCSTTTSAPSARCTSAWCGRQGRAAAGRGRRARRDGRPPASTRAYFRGTCLARWADSVVAANWDSLVLDVGTDPLRRIPMMEPTRGSKVHVAELVRRGVDAPPARRATDGELRVL